MYENIVTIKIVRAVRFLLNKGLEARRQPVVPLLKAS